MAVRVFWPTDTLNVERHNEYQRSIIIGWKNSDTDFVVVTTVPFLDPARADSVLRSNVLLKGSRYLPQHLYDMCGVVSMSVLGTMNCEEAYSWLPLRVSFSDAMKYPNHHATPATTGRLLQVVVFNPPKAHRMQYFSLYPVDLALADRAKLMVVSEEYEQDLVRQQHHTTALKEKLREHSGSINERYLNRKETLRRCIAQVNCCHELGELLRKNAVAMFPQASAERRRRQSVSEHVREHAQNVEDGLWNMVDYVWTKSCSRASSALIAVVMIFRILAEAILQIIDLRLAILRVPVREVSATAQQIDLRLQQLCYWPIQYLNILKRGRNWYSSTDFNIDYIRFYNSVWLTANDMILGMACGDIVLANQTLIVDTLCWFVDAILTREIKSTMTWLMDWPGGLKLNNELARFCGALFLWVIEFWALLLSVLRPYFPLMVKLIGYSSYCGATLMISLLSDLLSFLTLHVYAFYVASARIYDSQLVALYSLFQLFRGKKRNILRNRIDSYNYDLDQLLMGTILFTVLIFLLPTVAVFYLAFAFARLSIVLVCAGLESLLSFLNHFPLFILLLRFKDARRVPGGIYLVADDNVRSPGDENQVNGHTNGHTNGQDIMLLPPIQSFVKMEPLPLSFNHIFRSYTILADRLRMHYQSFNVVSRILTGQFVPIKRSKLYVLLYSSLPEHRLDISTLYSQLKKGGFK
jgi:phosphatidylinositol glycan class Q protein